MSVIRVGIIMGSQSDWPTMQHAADILKQLEINYEATIVSAHRTPDRLFDYAHTINKSDIEVIIAGAGGAAHLPGMTAAKTHLPVLGVPMETPYMNGMDSLLSIVQMPKGIPVGTLAIGEAGAINAALLAASIIATHDKDVCKRLMAYRAKQTQAVPNSPTKSKYERMQEAKAKLWR